MIGHVCLNVADLGAAKAYFDALMPLVDFEPYLAHDDQFAYRPANGKPGTFLFFYPALDREGAPYSQHRVGFQHLAFMVPSRRRVHEVRDRVAALGSEIIHEPQPWPEYPPPYYATFWHDPLDGFMLEAVCHKDVD